MHLSHIHSFAPSRRWRFSNLKFNACVRESFYLTRPVSKDDIQIVFPTSTWAGNEQSAYLQFLFRCTRGTFSSAPASFPCGFVESELEQMKISPAPVRFVLGAGNGGSRPGKLGYVFEIQFTRLLSKVKGSSPAGARAIHQQRLTKLPRRT